MENFNIIFFFGRLFRIIRFQGPNFFDDTNLLGNSKFIQQLFYLFNQYFIQRMAESIGSIILFITMFILLNNRSTLAFKLGNVRILIAKVARFLNAYPPEASLYSYTTYQNSSVFDILVHCFK